METRRLTARVEGRVQGVGFRLFTETEARGLDLVGWVRNEPDGSVRVVAEGPEPVLRRLLSALERGPRGGRVDGIDTEWHDASGTFDAFRVRR
jgi:acylphosphatase